MKNHSRINRPVTLAVGTFVASAVLVACGGGGSSGTGLEQPASVGADRFTDANAVVQPVMGSRSKRSLRRGQFTYRDPTNNRKLDQYQNWRLPVDVRVADLVKQMTL